MIVLPVAVTILLGAWLLRRTQSPRLDRPLSQTNGSPERKERDGDRLRDVLSFGELLALVLVSIIIGARHPRLLCGLMSSAALLGTVIYRVGRAILDAESRAPFAQPPITLRQPSARHDLLAVRHILTSGRFSSEARLNQNSRPCAGR